MSHFAKVEDGIVTNVIVAEQDFIDTLSGTWIQTSYRTRGGVHYDTNVFPLTADGGIALRKNYAGIGCYYDSTYDAFYFPKPPVNPSFVLNLTSFIWEPPIPYPSDGRTYTWFESLTSWVRKTTQTTLPLSSIQVMDITALSALHMPIEALSALSIPVDELRQLNTIYSITPKLSALAINESLIF